MNKRKPIVLFFLLFLYFNIYANAGVPMIAVIFPKTVLSLIPVILIETAVLIKILKMNKKKTAWAVVAGNLCSTLFGIPATWRILALLQISTGGDGFIGGVGRLTENILSVTYQAPWLLPYDDLHWRVPVAALFLLIPFFFVSWLTETWVERLMLKKEIADKKRFSRAVFIANLFSYAFLAAVLAVSFVLDYQRWVL
ncbi:hypothetical protein H0R92_06955 [Treponema sp. OMZ 840]|uniref:hypothetical protein n=1 Tax=Treponema sp. OMZ 840 TaxID=244313 RepID=UPI003D906AB6